jgi:hypothetical protein
MVFPSALLRIPDEAEFCMFFDRIDSSEQSSAALKTHYMPEVDVTTVRLNQMMSVM